jgi:hypothetical protein
MQTQIYHINVFFTRKFYLYVKNQENSLDVLTQQAA